MLYCIILCYINYITLYIQLCVFYVLFHLYHAEITCGSTAAPSAITISTHGGVLKWYHGNHAPKISIDHVAGHVRLRAFRDAMRRDLGATTCHDLWKDPKDVRTHQKWGFAPEC